MKINNLLATVTLAITLPLLGACANAEGKFGLNKSEIKELIIEDQTSQVTFDTAMAFMGAMGNGDMDKMSELMADDMIWHNEGDNSVPWIGPWEGKEEIFGFLSTFSSNFEVTKWENTDAFASGDTLAVFGVMGAKLIESGQETGDFTFALRAKVKDGKVVLWHWFENSDVVSRAYHGTLEETVE